MKPNVRGSMGCTGVQLEDGSDCEHYAPTLGLELVKGVLSHAAAAGRNEDHTVAVVDVRRAYFCAEPLPKTFELLDRHLDKMLRETEALPVRDETGCKVVTTCETEKGIKAAGMVMGKSPCGKWVGVVHGDDILLAGRRSLVDAIRMSLGKRYDTREQMV